MKIKLHLLAAAIALPIYYSRASAQVCGNGVFLGQLSLNPFLADSTANKFGAFGNPYSATSISNPYGAFGSPYSATSVSNPYATDAPKIIAADGQYLGRLSANPYDPDSISNPYGKYGSPYSPTSINNPYSQYGSPYCLARARESRHEVAVLHTGFRAAAPPPGSPMSPKNPYATQAPVLCGDED
jgi:hypothetical protein